jgi:hypothetical protein
MVRTMTDRDIENIENGKLHIGFKKLNDKDFERILQKLSQPRHREWRPRKCRKLEGIGAILAMLPVPNLWYLNFVGNDQVSDEGMKHLHLVPESVIDFDLSQCGLTAKGAKLLCEFLKNNTSITRMIMWGNNIGDEGAKYISEMLQVNTSIRELCLNYCHFTQRGFQYLSEALAVNSTLRNLSCSSPGTVDEEEGEEDEEELTDEYIYNLCPGLALNQGLDTLDFGLANSVTDQGIRYLTAAARVNLNLTDVQISQFPRTIRDSSWRKLQYYLAFNRCNRKIIRDGDASLSDWLEAVIKGSRHETLDFSFFFLRNKPELCMHASG